MYNLEWYDTNKNIKYPFYQTSGKVPNSVFVDALIQTVGDPTKEYKLSKYIWDSERLYVEISDNDDILALTGTAQIGQITINLTGTGIYLGSEGRLRIYSTDELPFGEYIVEEYLEP
jgi:hypothetical protein